MLKNLNQGIFLVFKIKKVKMMDEKKKMYSRNEMN